MKIIAVLFFSLIAGTALGADRPRTKPGFEKQILDITYGEVWRPKGWFYSWRTTASGAMWTVSREAANDGSYDTGMRIQLIILPPSERMTAEQFAKGFVSNKVASTKVERRCDEQQKGDFKTICVETTEPGAGGKQYRILYSVSWSASRKWVVVTTFGTHAAEWEALRPTVDAMTDVVLVGDKFYQVHKK